MDGSHTQPAVVIGVDGSAVALRAAMWAVDEAISRDVPLRLVHVIDSEDVKPDDIARRRAAAESAVCRVAAAIEATGRPVDIEVDIVGGRAAPALIRASRGAAMVCLGAVGSQHFQPERIGSTAAAVAGAAHCPVAIVHGHRNPNRPQANWIVVETDKSPAGGAVLETAITEAHLRSAPLRVITCWQPPQADAEAVAEGDRRIRAQLDRRLARWRRRYPDLRVEVVAVHGSISDYVATHAAELQLLVTRARPGVVREVAGPAGNAALGRSDCVVLVVDHRHL